LDADEVLELKKKDQQKKVKEVEKKLRKEARIVLKVAQNVAKE
jgi:hypothetical protein